jgi:hypothetical protein
MKSNWVAVLAVVVALGPSLAPSAQAEMTKCQMKYSMKGWSVFYQSATGKGTVTCDNGQTAQVTLRAKGGGLTAGKIDIIDGVGDISEVADIDQVFGKYASAEASAGAGNAAAARVVTKGPVSIALSGTGKGMDLGLSFGEFVIEKAQEEKSQQSGEHP